MILGLVLLVVPGIVLATWWLVVYQALVLERRGVLEALGRSRELVRGRFGLSLSAGVVTLAAYALPWSLVLLSDDRAADVAAVTLADVVSMLASAAVTTSLYRTLRDTRTTS